MVVTRTANRLPVTVSPPSRGAEIAKGVAAAVGTALIVVGIPLALMAGVGAPWPSEMPDRGWLASDLTTGGLLKVLAVVVWLAWAHFVVCLVVEAVAERRTRGLAPRVPGGGIGTQTLARRLIGAMVLLVSSATMSISTASAAVAPPPEHASVQQVGVQQVGAQRPMTASAASGVQDAPERESDKLPDTGDLDRATKADVRHQGRGLATYYDVKPPSNRNYDTLWDIAERYLGDGLRYKEIYDLNKGVTQPDGRVLKNADLIYPGWVMRMPSDANGPGLKVVDHADEPSTRGSGSTAKQAAHADDGAGQAPDAASGTAASGTAESGTAESGTATAAPQTGDETAATASGTSGSDWTPVYGVAGGLLAAGLALGLRRRRASLGPAALWAVRTGPGGPGPDGPDGGPPTPGSALRDEGDLSTARWLDRALRSWNGVAGSPPVPATSRCTLASTGLAVAFGAAPERPAPPGWETAQDGRAWSLPRHTDPLADPSVSATGPSPAPGLVSVGCRDDGSLLLLDLEAIPGLVSIGGDPTLARAVAMSVAIDTATHPWADDRRVTLVGFADDVSGVGQGNVRAVDDLERVLESLDNVASYQRAACRRADTVSARTARAGAETAEQWRYELVVCSGVPSRDLVARLSDLAADQQVSLAVVVIGDCPEAAARFAVTADGRLTSGILGVDVTAQQLSVPVSRALNEMFAVPPVQGALRLDEVAATLSAEVDVSRRADESVPVRIDVMGPVAVSAPSEPDPGRRELLVEILTYVALHPGGVHANRIGAAIWPRGVTEETRDAALGQVQQWLGRTADGAERLACDAGVWHLDRDEVVLDWDLFRQALNHASNNPRGRERVLHDALSLVRGRAWEEAADGRYSWLANATVEDDIGLAVGLTARIVAEAAAQRDDADSARDALQRGLAMVPASEELWCASLRLADRFGGTSDTGVVADQMYAAIALHGSPRGASAQTEALVEELLPGYRSHVA